MKFNWGTGIFIFLAFFVLSMIGLVILTAQYEVNLVTPDYYPKGITYQDQINKEARTRDLSEELTVSQDNNTILVHFPKIYNKQVLNSDIEGNILLFFPKSYRFDKNYIINLDSTFAHTIRKDSITWGRCIIKVDWKVNNIEYYQEKEIMIK
ncbi:MAG: FixH family protein [Bacteroidales bacterium]|nr:FixH family protein [Bacteroidales bacterium]